MTQETQPALESGTRLTIENGTTASYVVREQLAGVNFPTDAIGTTDLVTGQIVLDSNGAVMPEASSLSVDLRGLKSDDSRRDNYIRQNTLQTNNFPTADFTATGVTGLASPLPSSGEATFQVNGDMTIRGITRPMTWDVAATFSGDRVTGTTTASFTFDDYGMRAPSVFIVLSVEDTIHLKIEFTMAVERTG